MSRLSNDFRVGAYLAFPVDLQTPTSADYRATVRSNEHCASSSEFYLADFSERFVPWDIKFQIGIEPLRRYIHVSALMSSRTT
jgi:hypothetical protein